MTLRDRHLDPLSAFHRKILRGFLHLSDRSPIPSLFFLTGELPIVARLHRDVFSTFYNIWSNPQTKIFSIIKYLLEHCPGDSHTWARHVRNLAFLYNIEDPAELINQTPPSKTEFSNYILTRITVYYETKLRLAASSNSKMSYLNVSIKGLNGRVHPALSGIVKSKDVLKSRAHIKMLTDDLYTFERKSEYQGGSPHCRICEETGSNNQKIENLSHILTQCSMYNDVRKRIFLQMEIICKQSKGDFSFQDILSNQQHLTQFLLDCTSLNLPKRINPNDEICDLLFNLSRDLYCSIMKKRNYFMKKHKLYEL